MNRCETRPSSGAHRIRPRSVASPLPTANRGSRGARDESVKRRRDKAATGVRVGPRSQIRSHECWGWPLFLKTLKLGNITGILSYHMPIYPFKSNIYACHGVWVWAEKQPNFLPLLINTSIFHSLSNSFVWTTTLTHQEFISYLFCAEPKAALEKLGWE